MAGDAEDDRVVARHVDSPGVPARVRQPRVNTEEP